MLRQEIGKLVDTPLGIGKVERIARRSYRDGAFTMTRVVFDDGDSAWFRSDEIAVTK